MAVAAFLIALAGVLLVPAQASASGCTITWTGDVNGDWFGGTSGNNTNWTNDVFPDTGSHVCLSNTQGGPYTVTLNASTNVNHYSLQSDATLRFGSNVQLGAAANSSNAGTMDFQGADSLMSITDGNGATVETLTNTGTINFSATTGNPYLAADLNNQGTLLVSNPNVRFYMPFEARGPKLTNSGTITAQSGGGLTVQDQATLEQATGGTINGPGAVNVSTNSTLRIAGGQLAANSDVNLVNGAGITFTGAGTPTGQVDVAGTFTNHPITGNVPVGYSLAVKPGANLRATADWTNAGTITLIGASGQSPLLATQDGSDATTETLTNIGTITSSGSGFQYISGDLLNQGTITVPTAGFVFRRGGFEGRNPKLTNAGTLTALNGGVLTVDADATLEQAAGGTINGPGTVNVNSGSLLRVAGGQLAANSDVNLIGGGITFTGAGTPTGQVDAAGAYLAHPISGNLPATYTINVAPAALLRATANWTNAGTINLISNTSTGTAQLATENGIAANTETLTNTGTITVGGTGNHLISGDLVNQGTIPITTAGVQFRPSQENRPPKLTNAAGGSITFATGSRLDATGAQPVELQGGGVISGTGTLAVTELRNIGGNLSPAGAATGTFTVEGTYRQLAGGTLTTDVIRAGATTTADRLAMTGTGDANLNGILQIRRDGAPPALGSRFQIVTTGPNQRFGNFSQVRGALSGFRVEYFPNRVELLAVPAADVPALTVGEASLVEGNAGTADLVFPVTISPPPSPQVQVQVTYATSNDTATAGSDYAARTGTLTFAPGDTSEEIRVPVNGDTAVEPDESLLVTLTAPAGAPIRDGRATGRILGDDVSLTSLTPDRGGAPGSATITVVGTGFGPTSTLTLSRGGAVITGANPTVQVDGTRLTATFDLTGAAVGTWDVTATGRGGGTASRPNGFTIETAREGRSPVTATAPASLRSGFLGTFRLTLYNTGNTDETICLIRVSGENVEMRRIGSEVFSAGPLEIDGNAASDTPGEPKIGTIPPNSSRTLAIEYKSTTQVGHANLRLYAEVFTCEELPAGSTPPPPPPDLSQPTPPTLPPGGVTHPAPGGSAGTTTDNRIASDPNSIEGPVGVDNPGGDPQERWIRPDGDLGYTVRFENMPQATASAVLVNITETLDPAIDLDTFELGTLGWGDVEVDVPGGLQTFHGEVLLADGDSVHVDAARNRTTRVVTWRLATIDPDTGELQTDPDGGFLPPESGTGDGNGQVTYKAQLLDGVATGTAVQAQAQIVFDLNAPITTNTWLNTVDRQNPQSAVASVDQPGDASGANGCRQELDVNWAGSDTGGSGLDSYAVLVAKDGGPYETWSAATTATGGTLPTTAGAQYSFITLARDEVGNEEALPVAPDATVSTVACATPPQPGPGADRQAPETKIDKAPKARGSSKTAKFSFSANEAATFECKLAGKKVKKGLDKLSSCSSPKTYKKLKPGKYTFSVVAKDTAGNVDATPATAKFKVVKKKPKKKK